MAAQSQSNSCPKGACSVSEMAGRCELSRARFYDLIKAGVMPPPCYDLQTRRPLYPAALQQICLDVRRTNTALNGRYVIFNNKRTVRSRASLTIKKQPPRSSYYPQVRELVDGLQSLGITANESQIRTAMQACYPAGPNGANLETVLKRVFRHLRCSDAG